MTQVTVTVLTAVSVYETVTGTVRTQQNLNADRPGFGVFLCGSSDLAQGRSYWNRLRFLDVCEMATEIFSRKYFNKHFLIPALELVHDPVANVR